jgi:hypothetical protein
MPNTNLPLSSAILDVCPIDHLVTPSSVDDNIGLMLENTSGFWAFEDGEIIYVVVIK